MKIIPLDQLDNSFPLAVARNFGFRIPQTSLLVCEEKDESALDEQQLRTFYASFTSNTQQRLIYADIPLAKTYEIFPISLFCRDFEKYNIRSFTDFFSVVKSFVKDGEKIFVQRTIFAEKSGEIVFKSGEVKIKAERGMYVRDSGFEEYIFNQKNQEILLDKIFSQTTMLARNDYIFDLTYISVPQEQQAQPKLNTQDKILLRQFITQLQQLNLENTIAQFVIEDSSIFLIRFVNNIDGQVEEKELNSQLLYSTMACKQNLQLPFTQILFLSDANCKQDSYIYFNNEAINSSKWIIVKKEQINTLLSMINTYFLRNLNILLDCDGFDIYQIEEIAYILQNQKSNIGFLVSESDSPSIEDLVSLHPKQLLLKITSLSENLMRELETIISYCNSYDSKCIFLLSVNVSVDLIMQLLLLEKPLCFEITNEKDVANIYNIVQNCEQKLLFKAAVRILRTN